MGRHVVALLARRGHAVRALVRNPIRSQALRKVPVEFVAGELSDPGALALLAQGADVIVHLVGIIVESGRSTFHGVHVEGTRCLLAAAREAGVPRFVHMSAIGARAGSDATPYHRTKWEGEELVRASGFSYAIFRPSIISGPESAPIRTLARWHRWSPVVPMFGDGQFPTQPVWIEDIALAFALAAENARITGVFELGGPKAMTYETFVRAIGRATGHPRRLAHLPLTLARLAARVFDLLGPAAPLTSDQLQMLVEGAATPANAIESVFDISPLPFEQGLERYLGGRSG